MAALAKKVERPSPEPASPEELLTAYQLQTEADFRNYKAGMAEEHRRVLVRVGQLADQLGSYEARLAKVDAAFRDYESRFSNAIKEANEILRTSVRFSQEATKRVDVFERLTKEQGSSEKRNFAEMHRNIGEVRDKMRQLENAQNDLRGAFDEAVEPA